MVHGFKEVFLARFTLPSWMSKLNPDCNKIGFSGALCLPSKAGATGFVWAGMWEEQLHNRSVVTCGLQHCWALGLCRGEAATPCQTQAASFSRAWREGHSGAELSTGHWASLFVLGLEKVNLARDQAPCRNLCSPFLCSLKHVKKCPPRFHILGTGDIKSFGSPFTFINTL